MMDPDNTTVLWALDVLRRYAPHPLAPTEAEQRDSDHVEPPDAEQYFLEQQSPSDATFR